MLAIVLWDLQIAKHESRWAMSGSNVTAAICMLDPVLSCLYIFEHENFRMYDHD
jgi:hypothetical protein